MNKFYAIFTAALMTLLVSAADQPPPPAPPNNDKFPADQPGEPKKKEESLTYRQRMITGKVTDVKELEVTTEGKNESHLLAKVSMYPEADRIIVVDLGPKAALKTEIKTGDEIAAFGVTGRINKHPLIVASKIAMIVPIEGREDIFETLPASFEQSQPATSNQQLGQDALQRSNNQAGVPQQPQYGAAQQYSGPPQFDSRGVPINTSAPRFRTECEDR